MCPARPSCQLKLGGEFTVESSHSGLGATSFSQWSGQGWVCSGSISLPLAAPVPQLRSSSTWAGQAVLPGQGALWVGLGVPWMGAQPPECSAHPNSCPTSKACPNSLTLPSVFYHIRAAEASPLLRAASISPESPLGLAAEPCCRLPPHSTVPMSWCLLSVGWALPTRVVPAARAAWDGRELHVSHPEVSVSLGLQEYLL